MRIILSIIILLTSFICYSQKGKDEIKYSNEIIGKSFIDEKEILSECFRFPKRIEKLTLDNNPNEIAVYLRGVSSNGKWLDNEGNYIQFDLLEKSIRWSRKFSYTKMNWYTQSDSTIVFTSGFRSWLLDYNTGANKWKTKNNIYYIHPKINIGVAHGFSGAYGIPLIRGIDLDNGEELWNEELAHNKGWENFIILNDSTALLVSKGISLLNLKTGKVWQNIDIIKNIEPDSHTKQSFNLYKSIITGNLSEYQNEYNTKSNENFVLVDGSSVFICNNNEIASISLEDGLLNWTVSIRSHYDRIIIKENKDNFYIFQKNSEGTETSSCRILSVNKSIGEITFEKQFDSKVEDYIFTDNILYLISNEEIQVYNTSIQKKEIKQGYSNESFGEINFFVLGNRIYQNQDGVLKTLGNDKSIVLFTEQKKAIVLDGNLSVKTILDVKDLFLLKRVSENYGLVNKDNGLFLISKNGEILAELSVSENVIIKNDMLFSWEDNVLNTLDINRLMNK